MNKERRFRVAGVLIRSVAGLAMIFGASQFAIAKGAGNGGAMSSGHAGDHAQSVAASSTGSGVGPHRGGNEIGDVDPVDYFGASWAMQPYPYTIIPSRRLHD